MRRQIPRSCPSLATSAIIAMALMIASASPLAAQSLGRVNFGASPTPTRDQTPAPSSPPGDLGFRFHGYLRSGLGVDGHGKGQQAFQAPLSGAKYRLGNEAETYLETTFDYGSISEGPDPAYFDTRITLAYVAPTSQSNQFATTFSLREAYALARNLFIAHPGVTFWAGARFYDRHDLHLMDYFYRDASGFGGGVENVSIGETARFAASWIGGSQDKLDPNGDPPQNELFRLNKNTFEARAYQVDVIGGRLAAAVGLSLFQGGSVPITDGVVDLEDSVGSSATAIIEWPLAGGRHKLAVQYGRGAAYDFRPILAPPVGRTFIAGERVNVDDFWQFRVVNDFVIEQRDEWQLQADFIYQELDNGAAANNRVRWVSVGARPVYAVGRFVSIAAEAGWDYTLQSDLPGGSLFKLTFAPQITPALKYFSRPSLRAFATWAHWSDSFRGKVAPVSYPTAVQGASFGVQLETWW